MSRREDNLQQLLGHDIELKMSCFEVYREIIQDLLAEKSTTKLRVREDR